MTEPDSTLGFSYEFGVEIDINYGTLTAPVEDWRQLAFITNAGTSNKKAFSDAATYRDRGATRQAITGENWDLMFDHQVQRNEDGTFIDVLDYLIQRAKFGKRNAESKSHVRFFDTEGADMAGEGYAYVEQDRANKGNADIAMFSFSLTGDGPLENISNPYPGGGVDEIPTITTATPSGAAVGQLVAIAGTGFSSVAATGGVKFGAVVAVYTIDSGGHITATMPTGAAGVANITVTNANGISAAKPYTRGA